MSDFRTLKGLYIKHVSSDPSNLVAGDIWYNTTTQTLKAAPLIEAWGAGGNLGTGRHNVAGTGTMTAGLIFGGTEPPFTGTTEEYDGSSWTESGDLNLARDSIQGFGTQTAAVAAGGYGSDPGEFKSEVEEYNGSSWAEVTNLPGVRAQGAGAGVLTDGIVFGGHSGPPGLAGGTVEYDGTNWTAGGYLNTDRRYSTGAGTSTPTAICIGGDEGPSANVETYNGTAWTESGDLGTARYSLASSGNQTAALAFGGNTGSASNTTHTEGFDGTSWSTKPSLASGQEDTAGSAHGSSTSAWVAGGTPGLNNVEEFTGAVTARTWDTT